MAIKFFNTLIPQSKFTRMAANYISANLTYVFGQAISGLIVARLIDPKDMGIFITSTIIITYIPILLLGINNGLNRNLPYIIGQGRVEQADTMRNSALSFAIIASSIIFILVFAISIYFYFTGQTKLALAFLSTTITAALYPITIMKEVTYRTNNDFMKLSRIKFLHVGLALITVLIVYFLSFYGMLIRSAILSVFYLVLLLNSSTQKHLIIFDKGAIRDLMKTGLPIFLVSYIYTIYIGLDRILILKYFGIEAMGLYIPAIQVSIALAILPSSIFQIIYPKMATVYGQTGSINSLKKLAFTPLLYLALGLIPIFGIVAWLVGPFVELVLPKYSQGIPLARWMVLVFYLRCLGGPQDVLTVIGDMIPYGIFTVLAIILFYAVFLFLKNINWGLQAVTASLAFSTLAYNGIISIYVLQLMRKESVSYE